MKEKTIALSKADVEFRVDGQLIKFTVIHNLPDIRGFSFMDAFESWIVRAKKYNAKSLCNYIMRKDDSFVCLTEEQYNRFNSL